nr:MAG TPA: hypothetical protein [Caudoviricetes sp.]
MKNTNKPSGIYQGAFIMLFLWRLLGQVQNCRRSPDVIIHSTISSKSQRQFFCLTFTNHSVMFDITKPTELRKGQG